MPEPDLIVGWRDPIIAPLPVPAGLPFVDELTGQKQRRRKRFVIGSLVTHGFNVLVLSLICWSGWVAPSVVTWFALSALIGVIAFYLIVHFDLNLRLHDPSMSFEQIIFANLIGIATMSQMSTPLARALLSLTGMVSIVYAASGLSRGRLVLAMLLSALMSIAMIAWVIAHPTPLVDRDTELTLLAVMIGALVQVSLFGSQAATLRKKIRERNAELDRALADLHDSNLQLERERDLAARRAVRDGLTGIYNRRHLDAELEIQIARGNRSGATLSVAFLDIDLFKEVNDQHGHAGGDEVLRRIAQIVANCIRVTDVVGRYGGDEFLLMMPDTPINKAMILCERIRAGVAQEFGESAGRLPPVTLSAGLAERRVGEPLESMLARADAALYAAKAAGRNRVELAG